MKYGLLLRTKGAKVYHFVGHMHLQRIVLCRVVYLIEKIYLHLDSLQTLPRPGGGEQSNSYGQNLFVVR